MTNRWASSLRCHDFGPNVALNGIDNNDPTNFPSAARGGPGLGEVGGDDLARHVEVDFEIPRSVTEAHGSRFAGSQLRADQLTFSPLEVDFDSWPSDETSSATGRKLRREGGEELDSVVALENALGERTREAEVRVDLERGMGGEHIGVQPAGFEPALVACLPEDQG
jgi:hypothetical protein